MLGAVDSAKQAIGSRELAIVKHIHLQITVTTLKSSTRLLIFFFLCLWMAPYNTTPDDEKFSPQTHLQVVDKVFRF